MLHDFWRIILFHLPESTHICTLPNTVHSKAGNTENILFHLPILLASLVAHMLKHLPAIQETWVRSLDWEDPLEASDPSKKSNLERDTGENLTSTGLF